MDIWDDNDWPVSIRKKDDEQKRFHKAVSSAFFLMLDANDQTLPMDTVLELCRLPDTCDAASGSPQERSDRVMHDVSDEHYGQMLDVIEGLKIGLAYGVDHGVEQMIADFATSLSAPQDDFEVPLFRLVERRSTKPS